MDRTSAIGDQVGLATKLAYSVGALSDSIKTFSFSVFLLFYYTTVLGLPGTWLGLAMSVGLVWDAAADPLIGHLSDRITMPLGRRHGLMLAGAVGAGASFIAVFNPPSGLSTAALFTWLMVSSLCLRSSNSLFMVPYYALGAELTTDYHERTSISGYRAAAVLTGTLLAAAAAFLVFLQSESPAGVAGVDAKFARSGYASMGAAFGLAIMGAGLAATFGTLRERPRLAAPVAATDRALTLQRSALGTLRDRSFRVLVLSNSLVFMGTAINAALALHFLTYYVRIATSEAFTLFFVAHYSGGLAGVPVWVRATKWMEKHHVYAAMTIVAGILYSGWYWLVGEGRPLGTGYSWVLVVGAGMVGFFGAVTSVIVPSMMADITAHDELHSGCRRDGIFFGVYSFSQQLAGGLAVLIAGVLVDRFAGLLPARAEQSATTVERLAMISTLLPAVMLAGAGVIALRYRLTRRDMQSIRRELAASGERQTVPASEPIATASS